MKYLRVSVLIFVAGTMFANAASAQSTAFTFQGGLENGQAPANGNYDFEFALYGVLAGGAQLGQTAAINNVVVTNGTFAVRLDFGNLFTGSSRYLEIRVRQVGQPTHTTLTPRQQINSVPYSIRSLSADNADAVGSQSASSIAAAVLAVSSATQATVPNTLVMRNANGDFAASTIVATQQFNINLNRVLGINGPNNIFVGVNSGISNTSGDSNAFVGNGAGQQNTTGNSNSFFGRSAGQSNIGSRNSFFGRSSGASNTTGFENAFFGYDAGGDNTEGGGNAFFGSHAGRENTTGISNSYLGSYAGLNNQTGGGNSFFGYAAGQNTTSSSNSFFGYFAGIGNTVGTGNSFFGNYAGRYTDLGSANSFFGQSAGLNNELGFWNAFFGTEAGENNSSGNRNAFFGSGAGSSNTTGDDNTIIGDGADVGSGGLSFATALGAGALVSTSNTVVLGRPADIVRVPGFLRVVQLGSPGSTSLCQNVNDTISTCSSSIRYKSNVNAFRPGLDLIKRLRPVSFNWKEGGMLDMGLVAEEVAAIEPLLTTKNSVGEVEGVKYDRVGVVLVNAVKDQQSQIEHQEATIIAQRRSIDELKRQIEGLKQLVCATNSTADICKER